MWVSEQEGPVLCQHRSGSAQLRFLGDTPGSWIRSYSGPRIRSLKVSGGQFRELTKGSWYTNDQPLASKALVQVDFVARGILHEVDIGERVSCLDHGGQC